ncbi:MAG: polysaccharide biosynthesis C-terminal domain-containing protein [Phycisphaerae bacterium]|nr:polysaccharide biosynthesis C-terminal domain-containing protein [Phycisphaerae bacterium]
MNWTRIKSTFSPESRFNRDAVWNLGSLAVLAAAGLVLNFVVARAWSKDALGVFTQVYAIYIVLSQLAVGGVHASVLKEVSYQQNDLERAALSATSGLVLGAGIAAVVCAVCYPLCGYVGRLLNSDDVAIGLRDVVPGLFFFSLNKILLNILNGVRHMRAYAVFAAMRYLLILLGVLVIFIARIHYAHLAAALSMAEVALFVCLVRYVGVRVFPLRIAVDLRARMAAHFGFGVRGFLSALVSDLNTRVDAIMLGYFRTDALVGLYSMAAVLAEGFYQFPVVIQRNVNPLIGKAFAEDDKARIEWMARKTRRVLHAIMFGLCLVTIPLYGPLMRLAFPDKGYDESAWAFAILIIGIAIQSGFAPMGGILFQGGRPGEQTKLMALVLTWNILLNLALIPAYGINGAAIATGSAYVLQGILTVVFAKRHFGVRLL